MVFDKVYLIKIISAVTNYNGSSCYEQNCMIRDVTLLLTARI